MSSEKLRKSGANFETKSLLYLMNFHSTDIESYFFVVDFFNDLTGMDKQGMNLIDIQSKAKANACAKEIGRELVTLYKNYLSSFPFSEYILFLGGVPDSFRNDETKNEFFIDNIQKNAKKSLISGLKNEISSKEYTKNLPFDQSKFDAFLSTVLFVINSRTESDYIKGIIKIDHTEIFPENQLIGIFNEIRDKQSSKKNCSNIEGVTIQIPNDALNYGRHLTGNEIRLLTLNRLLLKNPFNNAVPTTFMYEVLRTMPQEKIQDINENCCFSISKILFDKNSSDNFWRLFENIYLTLKASAPSATLSEIYSHLNQKLIENCFFLDVLAIKYLIAAIKDGIKL